MSHTGSDIHNDLPLTAGSAGAVNTTNTLKALHMAVAASWPMIQDWKFVDGIDTGPFAAQQYVYSLASYTDITPKGIFRVWVEPSANTLGPDIQKRDWEAYQDANGDWQLSFHARVVANHVGKGIIIQYPARKAQPDGINSTIDLPRDYLIAYVTWWYAYNGLTVPHAGRGGNYEIRLMAMKREWEMALRNNKVLHPPIPYSVAKDRRFDVSANEDD